VVLDEGEKVDFMEQNVAEQRARARVKLGVESDLRRFESQLRAYKGDEDCATNAQNTFEEGIKTVQLESELTEEEKENFKLRFIEEMIADCKYDADVAEHWAKLAAEGLEHQKPVVTEAFAASVKQGRPRLQSGSQGPIQK